MNCNVVLLAERTEPISIVSSVFFPSFIGICVAKSSNKDSRFVDLRQRLQIDNLLPTNDIVYDHICPSILAELPKRTCPVVFFISCINCSNETTQTDTFFKVSQKTLDHYVE